MVWITLRFGWKLAFLLVGAIGWVWLVVWSFLYRTPQAAKADLVPPTISAWKLFSIRFVWTFTLAKVFLDPVWYFYIFWFAEYLKVVRHFSMASIGKYAWIPFAVAGLGNVLGGWTSALILQRGFSLNLARKGTVTLFVMLMTSAIPAILMQSVRSSIALVSIAMLGYTGCNAVMLACPADVFPNNVVGSIWGLASMGSDFGGMVFALLTGLVVDHFSYLPVFIGFGTMPLICAGILWALVSPIRPQLSWGTFGATS